MATYSNLPAQQGSKNAAITLLSTASLKLLRTEASEAGRVQTSTYVFEGSDAADRTVVYVRSETTKDGGRRNSVRLTTNVSIDLPDSEAERVDVYDVSVNWNYPSGYVESAADEARLIQVAAGLVLGGFDGTTGLPAATVVNAVNFGRTEVW
jgi:hypothetical protein